MSVTKKSSLTSRKLSKLIAEYAYNKKAMDIVILDMRKVVSFCDYFVLCSGNTDRQVRAIALGIEEGMEEHGLPMPRKQGFSDSRWVLLDFCDVVVHIFEKRAREFYGLEYLWQEAKQVKWEGSQTI